MIEYIIFSVEPQSTENMRVSAERHIDERERIAEIIKKAIETGNYLVSYSSQNPDFDGYSFKSFSSIDDVCYICMQKISPDNGKILLFVREKGKNRILSRYAVHSFHFFS